MNRKAFLEIGKITSLHGIKGFLRVRGWCDDVYVFKSLSYIYLDENGLKGLKIKNVKFIKQDVLLLLEGIEDVEKAKELIGVIIYAKREDLKIKEDENFIQDLIGIKINDYYEKTKCYGEIKDVLKIKGRSLYLIKTKEKKEVMIPANEEFIKEKRLDEGKIYVKLISGMLE